MKKRPGMKKLLKGCAAAAALCVVLAGAVMGARKAMTLYNRLSKKLDYVSGVLYELETDIGNIDYAVSKGLAHYDFDYAWTKENTLIAHALGGIDGKDYTNSYEAFLDSYAKGHRVFEVDFGLTEDAWTMVCVHDPSQWRDQAGMAADTPFTYAHFMESKLYDRYTTMDYRDVVDLMIKYPDVYLVTDTKSTDQSTVMLQFAQLVKYAEARDAGVLNRIIPQVYHEGMLNWVMAVYPFDSVIFTLYATDWTRESVLDFCERSGVGMVTLWDSLAKPEDIAAWKAQGIRVAVHTVNDAHQAQDSLARGADLIYTDFLAPDQF